MMRNVRGCAVAAALVAGAVGSLRGAPLAAQEPEAPLEGGAPSARTITIWTALGRDEPLTTRIGRTYDRDLYIVGVQVAQPLRRGGAVRLEYVLDVIPAIVTTENPLYEMRRSRRQPSSWLLARTRTVYGMGIAPLGLQLRAGLGRRAALLTRTSAGGAIFMQPIPDPNGTRFNFTVDLSAALELRLTRTLGATAGFRLHHLSNGGTGEVNPGMNTRMLELGVAWLPR